MVIKYDRETDILYIKFNNRKIEESEEMEERVIFDYSTEGLLVGIEVLDATSSDFQLEEYLDFIKAEGIPA